MTPTWQTVTADDLSSCWLELDISPWLFVVVRPSDFNVGFVAKMIHGELAAESPVVDAIESAKRLGESMVEQHLFDLASEAMTLAGAE